MLMTQEPGDLSLGRILPKKIKILQLCKNQPSTFLGLQNLTLSRELSKILPPICTIKGIIRKVQTVESSLECFKKVCLSGDLREDQQFLNLNRLRPQIIPVPITRKWP